MDKHFCTKFTEARLFVVVFFNTHKHTHRHTRVNFCRTSQCRTNILVFSSYLWYVIAVIIIFIMDELKRLLGQLTNLIGDADFKQELKAYRGAFQRLKIRLRNCPFTAKLKQLKTYTRQLETQFSVELLQTYGRQITQSQGKKQKHALECLEKLICQLIKFIDRTLDQTIYIYCHTQLHFKIGHLIHHLIMIRSTIARVRVCLKALLVYASDLIMELSQHKEISTELMTEINEIMGKQNCKPREASRGREKIATSRDGEEIGLPIDRVQYNKELKNKKAA